VTSAFLFTVPCSGQGIETEVADKTTPALQTLSKIKWFLTNAVEMHLLMMSPVSERAVVKLCIGSYILYGIC
jgi:hypothetical protein